MKPHTPPPLTLDDKGKITNLPAVTRWAYINDPLYRRTDTVSDLLKESYVARLERLVAVQIINRAELQARLIDAMGAQNVVLTVTTPQDAPDDSPYTMPRIEWPNVVALLTFWVGCFPLGFGLAKGNYVPILVGILMILAGMGYLLRRKGGVA